MPALFGALLLVARPALALDDVPATGSNFGRVGLLEMPNARFRPDGVVESGISWRQQREFWFVNFQALPFLETTFRLSNRLNGTTGRGTTTDRAFDLKLRVWEENAWRPALAIGLQDVIGTGIYQGEYIVASKRFWALDATMGMGWGRLSTGQDVTNPFTYGAAGFGTRPRSVGQGGTFAWNSLFRGSSAGIFAGLEYSVPPIPTPWGAIEGLRAKLEYSADVLRDERGGYPARTSNLRGEAASRFNIGFNWQPNPYLDIGASFVHGTDVLIRASLRLDPNAPPDLPRQPPPLLMPRPSPEAPPPPEPLRGWRERLLAAAAGFEGGIRIGRDDREGEATQNASIARRLFPALRDAGFIPISLDLRGEEAHIAVSGGRYRTLAQVTSRVVRAAQPHLPPETERIRVIWERDGVVIARLVTLREAFENQARGMGSAEEILHASQLLPAYDEPSATAAVAAPPRLTWGVAPAVNLLVGDPQTAVRWQVGVAAGARLELGWNTAIAGAVQQAFAGNLDGGLPSDSVLPHVRSDFARYARAATTTIPAIYAERIWTPARDVFARVTAGMLEPMFGGVSGEILWRPRDRAYALGLDVNWVAQRQYTQNIGTLGYSVVTGQASLYLDLPVWNLYTVLRGGRYLAGDWGGTIEMGRRFDSGIEVGGFATFTNVSYSRFGEGSFDKGIYVRVPFDFFGVATRNRANLNIRPVQRDGGQRLAVDNALWDVARDGRADALRRGFEGFSR
ncbi:YjbH domain-containing protein [Sediminicoccus sp. KRV36]|uniref:YjbH domain-containing protein n=1 Tax=Sediminicoccus sp. KRV36 TaxID=3133721 RepID=UPI00200C857B|nr:YjbH domain-containing protein [Sediminicoccus rosea]UPY36176.1 YjbH domain-containing protein [Sediminicoccus rosea]